jgi:hypothetical protein
MTVVILQKRECDSGAHINESGDTAERAMRVQRAIILVILQRECNSGAHINHAHINESGNIADRAIRVVILQRQW